MTDKQIIIDGVDVSGCKYIIDYDPPEWQGTWGGAIHKGACRRHSGDCKCNPNCYYKQLKRKEQECENGIKRIKDLEERILNHSNTIEEYCSRLASKEQECEALALDAKVSNDHLQARIGMCDKCAKQLDQLKAENKELKEEIFSYKEDCKGCNSYYEASENARIYRDENTKLKQTLTEIKEIAEEKANVNDWLALEILQKISECEGVE